jgi:hypothetical protein
MKEIKRRRTDWSNVSTGGWRQFDAYPDPTSNFDTVSDSPTILFSVFAANFFF